MVKNLLLKVRVSYIERFEPLIEVRTDLTKSSRISLELTLATQILKNRVDIKVKMPFLTS